LFAWNYTVLALNSSIQVICLLQVTVKCVLCTEISPRVLNHIKEGPLSRRTSVSTKINSIRPRDERRQHQTWENHTYVEMLIIALQEREHDFACNIRVYITLDCEFSYATSSEKLWRVLHRGPLDGT